MAKVFIEETTLTSIGDAIREKGGTSELINPLDMPNAITNLPSGGGGIEVEPIVLAGDQQYGCSGNVASKYIELFGDTISTYNISNLTCMFHNYKNSIIPFDINCYISPSGFRSCFSSSKITQTPRVINLQPREMDSLF
jgi:hypothetical protein